MLTGESSFVIQATSDSNATVAVEFSGGRAVAKINDALVFEGDSDAFECWLNDRTAAYSPERETMRRLLRESGQIFIWPEVFGGMRFSGLDLKPRPAPNNSKALSAAVVLIFSIVLIMFMFMGLLYWAVRLSASAK